MTKVITFLKSIFDMIKSMMDLMSKRSDVKSNTCKSDNGEAINKSDKGGRSERKPWLVIHDGKIEVYKDGD